MSSHTYTHTHTHRVIDVISPVSDRKLVHSCLSNPHFFLLLLHTLLSLIYDSSKMKKSRNIFFFFPFAIFSRETSFHLSQLFLAAFKSRMEIKQCLAFYENTNYRQLSGVLFTNFTGRPNGKWELARDISGGNYSPCYEIFVFFPPPLSYVVFVNSFLSLNLLFTSGK